MESILEYLESLGIQNGSHLLKSLGLLSSQSQCLSQNPEKSPQSSLKPQSPINLKILTNLLNNEIETRFEFEDCNADDFLVKSGILACRSEVKFLRSNFDNVTFERNKLRLDLGEANQRALLLAQEIDDQNARLERASQLQLRSVQPCLLRTGARLRDNSFISFLLFLSRELEQKYVDQIRELQMSLSDEKEQHLSLTLEMDSKRRQFSSKLSEKEGELREEMSAITTVSSILPRNVLIFLNVRGFQTFLIVLRSSKCTRLYVVNSVKYCRREKRGESTKESLFPFRQGISINLYFDFQENKRLERENSALTCELKQVRSLNATLHSELEALAALKARLLELEGACAEDEADGKSPREQISELNERVVELTNLNKDLRDQNDELNLQIEASKVSG